MSRSTTSSAPSVAPSIARVESATRLFVERVVIDLGLCPFAREPWDAGRIEIVVSEARDETALLEDLDREATRLIDSDPRTLETTLLVHPQVLGDFIAFNDFLDPAESLLRARGLEGVLQIASFHPDYRFAGAPSDDPANATNRSPWPMLHLLREASVEAAIAAHPDAEGIPDRNMAVLRELGAEKVAGLLASLDPQDD